MKLHRLTARNFMPYKGEVSVDFPPDDYRNVMIVFGENMRGKTSLLNAVRWAFYGQALGRHSRPIPLQLIVNKDAAAEDDWNVEAFVTFDADGRQYELRRTASRRSHVATPTKPEDFQVAVHLTRDGVVIAGDQIEAELDQIAPEQISRFFLFDGELLQEYEELLVEGSEQGRLIKESIEEVLGVPALTRGRAELGAILKSATKRQSQEMAHIQGLEKQAELTKVLTARLESHETDLNRLQDKLQSTRTERNELEDALEAAATVIALKAKLDAARGSAEEHRTTLQRKRSERHELLAVAWQDMLDAKLETKRTILRDRQKRLTDELRDRSRIEGRVEDVKKALDARECPTCHQPTPEKERERLGRERGELEAELSRFTDNTQALQDVSAQLAALNGLRGNKAKDRLVQLDRDLRSAEVGLQKAENEIERVQEQISGQDTAELARKRVLHQEALKEEGRLSNEIESVRRDIQKVNEELAIARKAIEGLAPARSKRITLKVKLAAELEQCFAVSIDRLRDELRKRVESLASDAFKAMTTQKAYQGLTINNNYGLDIIDSRGRPVSVRSAGAEQIVALSLIDGLNRTGRAVGPVIMDTPLARLDPGHRDNLLSYLPTVTSQLVLLVHGGEIRPDTDLAAVKARLGATYRIEEISDTQSRIERIAV
jgi:DNA sulfur modification protein DndD